MESGVDSEKSRSLVDFATARDGQTALHLAAENASENADILAAVIQHSSNINAKDNLGEQARMQTVSLFIIQCHIVVVYEQTPLYLAVEAASGDFTEAVELLIRRGATLHDLVDGRRVSDMIQEKFPDLDPASIAKESISAKQRDTDILGAVFGHLRSVQFHIKTNGKAKIGK